jgi:hypothetical protein
MSASSSSSVHGDFFTNNANKSYQNDTLNPYFMHPNENPLLSMPLCFYCRIKPYPKINQANIRTQEITIKRILTF